MTKGSRHEKGLSVGWARRGRCVSDLCFAIEAATPSGERGQCQPDPQATLV